MRNKIAMMSLTLLGLAAASNPENFQLYGAPSKTIKAPREVRKGHFGATEITEIEHAEDGTAKVTKEVYPSGKHFTRDYERQTRALNLARTQNQVNKERMQLDKIYSCDNRGNVNPFGPDDAGFFIPVNVGSLNAET